MKIRIWMSNNSWMDITTCDLQKLLRELHNSRQNGLWYQPSPDSQVFLNPEQVVMIESRDEVYGK